MTKTVYDAVVIGSGAGGAASAYALSRHGLRVLLLEAGPAYDAAVDYDLESNDWERRSFPHKIAPMGRYTIAPLQTLSPEYDDLRSWNHLNGPRHMGPRREAVAYHHVVGLGGSTLQFTGEAHRLNPESMKMFSDYGVAADWPFDYAELEPYYLAAERMIGVAGERDSTRWSNDACPLPAHPPSYASSYLGAGCAKLGLSWTPNYLAALSKPYNGRPACNYCGNCNRGCPRGDKGSADVTFIAAARNTGRCTIETNATVTRLDSDDTDTVRAVHYVRHDGSETAVKSRVVVLACGAVETPRLLLNSANEHAPDGLANESGEVGKNFMETLFWSSAGLHAEALASFRGLPSDSICWDYNAPNAIPDVIGGCRFAPSMAESDLLGPINYAQRVVGGWGRAHQSAMRNTFGRILSIGAVGESLPNADSYVALDPEQRDARGLPLARIHSHLPDHELHRLRFMSNIARKILDAAGVEKLVEEYGSYDAFSSTHVFGTCRMGSDPTTSVVNPFGRSNRWRNLFISDASVFPSSGGGEAPVLTIHALALRTGEHIASLSKRKEL